MKTKFTFLLLLSLIGLSSVIAQGTLDSGLVAKYYFNGNANDESGNANNGTVNGATLTTDRFGNADKAYSFDGVNNYIIVPNNSQLNLGKNNFSFSFWVKYSSQSGGYDDYSSILTKADASYPYTGLTFFVEQPTNGKALFRTGATNNINSKSSVLNNNTWTNFAGIRDGYTLKLFINGVMDTTITTTIIDSISNNFDLFFGGHATDMLAQKLGGLLDDIRIYNRALNTQEIQALYEEQNPMLFTTEYYNLDDSLVPQGWSFIEALPNADISNGQMNAYTVDAKGNLERQGIMPNNVEKVILEWDGDNATSYWGRTTFAKLYKNNGNALWFGNATAGSTGADSYVTIMLVDSIENAIDTFVLNYPYPLVNTQYHYSVFLSKDSIGFCAINISNQSILFNYNLSLQTEGIVFPLDSVVKIAFGVHTTTDNNNWLDNPKVTIIESQAISATITIPDSTIQITQTLEIPINTSTLQPSDSIIAYQFNLAYDSSKLQYSNNSLTATIADGGSVTVNSGIAGILNVSYMTSAPLSGTGAILKLQFQPLQMGTSDLTISDFLYNTDTITTIDNGIVTVIGNYGDVDANTHIQAYDAALALQYSVGLDPLPAIDPLPWENWRTIVANVDGVDTVTANDASLILQYSAGLITTFPVEGGAKSVENTSDIIINQENNELVFSSTGNLFGLNISAVSNPNIQLGTPQILAATMLSATNISGTNYKIGLCTATAIAENNSILRIPFTVTDDVNVTFEMFVNEQHVTKTVLITNDVTGINKNSLSTVNVFPNPTTGKVYINSEKLVTIKVYNVKGELIMKTNNSKNNSVSLSEKGEYMFELNDGKNVEFRKVVVQ